MMDLAEHDGNEVFILAGSEDEALSELDVDTDSESLKERLLGYNPGTDSEMRVFHGILCSAEVLPASFKGKSAFVVIADNLQEGMGSVIETQATDPRELADEIESIIHDGGNPASIAVTEIEDVYILYGYQIKTCLTISDDSIDEEILAACEDIRAEIDRAKDILAESEGAL